MEVTIWSFLTVGSVCLLVLMLGLFFIVYKQKMKELEIEKQKIEKTNLQNEVSDAVDRELGSIASRIEVLEAIVTDKNYGLSDKIERLK